MNSDPPSPETRDPIETAPARTQVEMSLRSDSTWLNDVFHRYQRPLVAYVGRMLGGDWDRARDCVQDVFLKLCREQRSLVEGHVEAWLFKSCRHRALDIHRKESRMIVQFTNEGVLDPPQPGLDPSRSIIAGEEREHLQQEIAALPAREQEVLVLRLQQGLSYRQIADVMDLSVSHVGVLLHQAVTRLKACLPSES